MMKASNLEVASTVDWMPALPPLPRKTAAGPGGGVLLDSDGLEPATGVPATPYRPP